MIIVGLTGSVGMGKTTVAGQFKLLGAKVFCADGTVHWLLEKDKAIIKKIAKHFSDSVMGGRVDRKKLGNLVFFDKKKRKLLEEILYPSVAVKKEDFLTSQKKLNTKIVVLDIPLLFETNADENCDITVVVTAPDFIQDQRVLRRAGMNKEKYSNIKYAQMSEHEKRSLADYVIETGLGKAHSFRQVKTLMNSFYVA